MNLWCTTVLIDLQHVDGFTKSPNVDSPETTAKLTAMLTRHANELIAPLGKNGMDPLSGGSSASTTTSTNKQQAKQNLSRIVGTTIHKNTNPVSNIDVHFADILANQIKIDHVDALHFLLLAKVRVSQIRPQMNVFRVMANDYPWLEYQRMVAIRQNRSKSSEIADIENVGLFVVSNARRYYINERQNLFWIISDLMKARRGFHLSSSVSAHKRGVILEFTDKLLQGGFAINIMKTLLALFKRSNELGHAGLVEPCQQILCESLIFLFEYVVFTNDSLSNTLKYYENLTTLEHNRYTSHEGRDSRSFNLDQDGVGTRTASKSAATSSIVGTESLYFDQCVDVCYGTNNGVSSSG